MMLRRYCHLRWRTARGCKDRLTRPRRLCRLRVTMEWEEVQGRVDEVVAPLPLALANAEEVQGGPDEAAAPVPLARDYGTRGGVRTGLRSRGATAARAGEWRGGARTG